jgi:hypothetical protein
MSKSVTALQALAALSLAVAAGVAQAQAGGMSGSGNPGPGFMGSGSGSTGTVDGGMSGTRETPPGAARAGRQMRAARNAAPASEAPHRGLDAAGPAASAVPAGGGNGGSPALGMEPGAARATQQGR